MSLGDNLNYIQHIEHLIGENNIIGLDDTANRAIKELVAKFDNGEADTQVYRNFFKIDAADLDVGVQNDDLVSYDKDINKWVKATDSVYGVIDVDNLSIYVFGVYTMKNETGFNPGSKYYLDSLNPGEYTTSGVSGKVFGDAITNDTILILALSGTTANPTVFTNAPIISGPSNAGEGVDTEYTITNYSIDNTYVLNSLFGSVSRVDDKITFTPDPVAGATSGNFRVSAQNVGAGEGVSPDTTTPVTIYSIENDTTDSVGADDGVLLYNGATLNGTFFPSPVNGSIISNEFVASADNAVFESIADTQDGAESDYIALENIFISQDGDDVLNSADVTECIVDAVLNIGDKVLLTDGIDFIFYELIDSTINVSQTTFTHSQSFVPIKCFVNYENSLEVSLDNGNTYLPATKTTWSLVGNTITENFENVSDATTGNRDIKMKLTIGKNNGTCNLMQGNIRKRL